MLVYLVSNFTVRLVVVAAVSLARITLMVPTAKDARSTITENTRQKLANHASATPSDPYVLSAIQMANVRVSQGFTDKSVINVVLGTSDFQRLVASKFSHFETLDLRIDMLFYCFSLIFINTFHLELMESWFCNGCCNVKGL